MNFLWPSMTMIAFSVFVGMLTAVGAGPYLVAMASAVFVSTVYVSVYGLRSADLAIKIWVAIFLFYIIGSVANAFTGFDSNKIMVVLFFLFSIYGFLLAMRSGNFGKTAVIPFFFYFLYISILLISTFFGHSKKIAAIYQLFYDARILLLVFCAYAFCNWQMLLKCCDFLFYSVWLICAPFVLLQTVVSQKYFSYAHFLSDGYGVANPLLPFMPGRVVGPFVHSSVFVGVAIFLILYGVAKITNKRRGRDDVAIVSIYALYMVLSGQREENLAIVLTLAIIWILIDAKHFRQRLIVSLIAVGTILAGAYAYAGADATYSLLSDWGLAGYKWVWEPRAVMYQYAHLIASKNFPLGSGLGTFGSVGAVYFDQSLYFQYGFTQFFWFVENKWLLDTFWPHMMAESGWIGSIFILMFYVSASVIGAIRLIKTRVPEDRIIAIMALSAYLYNLFNSPTSPVLGDPTYMWLFLPFMGAVFMRSPWQEIPGAVDESMNVSEKVGG